MISMMYIDKQQKRNNDNSGSSSIIINNNQDNNDKTKCRHRRRLILMFIVGIMVVVFVLYPPIKLTSSYLKDLKLVSSSSSSKQRQVGSGSGSENHNTNQCSYRNYGNKGLYGMSDPTYPQNYEFLRSSLYLHGKQPTILPTIDIPKQQQQQQHETISYLRSAFSSPSTARTSSRGKLCFDAEKYMESTATETTATSTSTSTTTTTSSPPRRRRIITPEGSNPTLISFERILSCIQNQEDNDNTISPFQRTIMEILIDYPTAAYIVSTTSKNTNHQCRIQPQVDDEEEQQHQQLTSVGFHVNILIVDIHMNTLLQTIVQVIPENEFSKPRPLVGDDARLFLHNDNNEENRGSSSSSSTSL